jgi:putative serine/threonine protein kinase
VLCYPSPDVEQAERRIQELKQLNVSQLVFEGRTRIGNLGLLGKGCVGLVVKAETINREIYALKIRRSDANRPSMQREAAFQRIANGVDVGAKLINASDNFLLMEVIDGEKIQMWINKLHGVGSTSRMREGAKAVLEQCFRLDQVGLDHGELSNLEKHVLVGRRIVILDFETASMDRRSSNVTSALQNILIGGPQSRKARRLLRLMDTGVIIQAARRYKVEPDKECFDEMLRDLHLA